MKIAVISTFDKQGGASLAALRLHKGFRSLNRNSNMIVRYKHSNDPDIYTINDANEEMNLEEKIFKEMEIMAIEQNRTDLSNTFMTLPYPGYNIAPTGLIQAADIINLHWVVHFQSVESIASLLELNKPVVWTLHDQNAFTGGCHYSAGCLKYREDCRDCPQLNDNRYQIPFHILNNKIKHWHVKRDNLTIVTPSRWLAECARESKLFKGLRVESIPNSVDINEFRPIDKKAAKKELGLAPGQLALLFGAHSSKEKRKGFAYLVEALRFCLHDPKFKRLAQNKGIKILTFGPPQGELKELGIELQSLGIITGKNKLAALYSASDLFVLPSLEDNLPNTMLESMACGTPVISFAVGGMPDLIQNGITGAMAQCFDTEKFGQHILDLVFDDNKMKQMGINCRQTMEQNFKLQDQAANYLGLFNDLGINNNTSSSVSPCLGKEIFPTEWARFSLNDEGIFEIYRKSAVKILAARMRQRRKWQKRLKTIKKMLKISQSFFEAVKRD